MFEIYLSTIFLWMIIIFCAVNELYDPIVKNGWMDGDQYKMPWEHTALDVIKAFIMLVLISSVPLFRALLVIGFYLMSRYTERQFDEWFDRQMEKLDKHQEE